MKRNYAGDVLRNFLIIIVFLCHSSFLFSNDEAISLIGTATGWAMEMFFVLSGFFIAIKYMKKNIPTVKEIAIHEWVKIYPEYFIGYIMCVFLEYWQKHYYGDTGSGLQFVKRSLLNLGLLQSWVPNEDYYFSFNGVSWFLSSLFFCYLLSVPAMTFLRKKIDYSFLVLCFTIATRYIYVSVYSFRGLPFGYYFINIFPLYRFFEFFVGMSLGVIYYKNQRKVKKASIIQMIGILLFSIMFIVCQYIFNLESMNIVIETFVIYVVLFYDGMIDEIGKTLIMRKLANINLQFYLFHQIVIKYFRWFEMRFGIQVHAVFELIILFGITVVLCVIIKKLSNIVREKILKYYRKS